MSPKRLHTMQKKLRRYSTGNLRKVGHEAPLTCPSCKLALSYERSTRSEPAYSRTGGDLPQCILGRLKRTALFCAEACFVGGHRRLPSNQVSHRSYRVASTARKRLRDLNELLDALQ
jgi:hypothetical protein